MMNRTMHRALPSKRIPAAGKGAAAHYQPSLLSDWGWRWWLHPYAFIADLVGTVAAVVYRKRATCIFPQGMLASCAPVLMGWFAILPAVSWELLLLCVLIAVWLPLHVWSVMIANRDDYRAAGLNFFPMNREVKDSVKVLLMFALILYGTSVALYFIGDFSLLYLIVANVLGIMMLFSTARLVISKASSAAWRLYKLSSFPYLGLIFLVMLLDMWILR